MGSVTKRALGVLAAIVLLAAALVAVGAAVWQLPATRRLVLERAVGAVAEKLDGRLEVQSIGGNLFSGLALEDVRLFDRHGALAARVAAVELSYKPWALTRAGWHLERLELVDPLLIVRVDAKGETNLQGLVREDPLHDPESGTGFSVQSLRIRNGTVLYLGPHPHDTSAASGMHQAMQRALEALGSRPADIATLVQSVRRDVQLPRPTQLAAPTAAALLDVDVQAGLEALPSGDVTLTLERLGATAWLDTTSNALPVDLQDGRGSVTSRALDWRHEKLHLGPGLAVDGLAVALPRDSEAARNVPSPVAPFEGLSVHVARLRLAPDSVKALTGSSWLRREVEAKSHLRVLRGAVDAHLELGTASGTLLALKAKLKGQSGGPSTWEAKTTLEGQPAAWAEIVELPPSLAGLRTGELHLDVDVSGEGLTPRAGTGRLRLEGLSSGATGTITRLGAAVEYRDRTWRLEQLNLAVPDGRVEGRAMWSMDGPFDASAQASFDGMGWQRLAGPDPMPWRARSGQIDLRVAGELGTAELSLQNVRRVELGAKWQLSDVSAVGLVIGDSDGALDVDVRRTGAGDAEMLDLGVALSASAKGAAMGGNRIAKADVQAKGRARLAADALPNWRDSLSVGSAQVDARIKGLSAEAVGIGDLALAMNLEPAKGAAPMPISASLDASGLRGAVQAVNVAARLRGSLPGPWAGGWNEAIGGFSGNVTTDVERFVAGPFKAQTLRLDARAHGAGPQRNALLQLRAVQGVVATRPFAQATAVAQWRPSWKVRIDAALARPVTDGLPLHLALQANASELPRRIEITEASFGTVTSTWRMKPQGRVVVGSGAVRLEDVQLVNGPQSIALSGAFTAQMATELTLSLKELDLAQWHRDYLQGVVPVVQGFAHGTLAANGPWRDPQIEVVSRLEDLRWEAIGPIRVALRGQYALRLLELHEFRASDATRTLLEASARLPLAQPLGADGLKVDDGEPLALRLAVDGVRWQELRHWFPELSAYQADARAHARLEVGGTASQPSLGGTLELADVSYEGAVGTDFLRIAGAHAKVELGYERQTSGPMLRASGTLELPGQAPMSASASLALPSDAWLRDVLTEGVTPQAWLSEIGRRPMMVRLEAPSVDLRRLPLASFAQADAMGRVTLELHLTGSMLDPVGHLDFAVRDFGWGRFRDIELDVRSRLRDQKLFVDRVRLGWDSDEILAAKGVIPVPLMALGRGMSLEDIPVDFAMELRPLPIAKLSAVDYDFAQLRGTLGASLRLTGTLREPAVEARAGLFDTDLGQGVRGTVAVEATASENRLRVSGTVCREQRTLLEANADAPVLLDVLALAAGQSAFGAGPLSARIKSEVIDLAGLLPARLLRNHVSEVAGTMRVNVAVDGTWENPRAMGTFDISDGAATLPALARRFENIEADVVFEPSRITLARLSASDGSGSAQLEGSLDYNGLHLGRLDARWSSEQFNTGGIATEFPAFVTSQVRMTGHLGERPMDLDVRVSGLDVRLADIHARDLHPLTTHEDIVVVGERTRRRQRDHRDMGATLAVPSTREGRLNLRATVQLGRDSWVRHPNGNVNFHGALTADWSDSRLNLEGDLRTVRGDFEFLGRKFTVAESSMVFTGDDVTAPMLQIEASHTMDRAVTAALGPPSQGEPRIVIRISGTPRQPRLEMTSDPVMTDSEILYVLVTGRPPDRSDVGQGEGVANRALSAVSGLFLGMLQDQLADTVPVDVLRLEAGESGLRGGRLEVGKYITNDIFVSYRYQFGALETEATNVIRVEYHFLPRWMVEFLYTDRNEGEFNLFWDAL